jgi:hypothetical protein
VNSSIVQAYMNLRKVQKITVHKELDIRISQGIGETGTQYATRVLRQIEHDGKMRELEEVIQQLTG